MCSGRLTSLTCHDLELTSAAWQRLRKYVKRCAGEMWPVCKLAGCLQGYMCASNTPCLDDSGQCTSKCVPLAASWCQNMCPNAFQYVPTTNPVSPPHRSFSHQSGSNCFQSHYALRACPRRLMRELTVYLLHML